MPVDLMAIDEAEWRLAGAILDYDPRPAMRRVAQPLLAMFGADDVVVPVADSIAIFREHIREDLLTVSVVNKGDHRLQIGDPKRLVDSYAPTLITFICATVRRPA
jgi:pimeloyl-ACP methyl ester carboxylesterase